MTSPITRQITRPGTRVGALRRLTASTTAGGVMLVGTPLMLDYVVRPGDTLSEIAGDHGTSVSRIVERNGLPASGDTVYVGQRLDLPSAHGSRRDTRAAPQPVSPDRRRMVAYTVRPGDTPSGLAVRFHAWTAELIEMNSSVLRVGDRITIPVVVAAARADRADPRPAAKAPRPAAKERTSTGPSRSQVRRVIEATAARYGVDPQLALAVSWQEAGWQMHHVSSADAVGAMQVIPTTGEWMSGLLGRSLRLHDLQDNVTAGVVLLKLLLGQAPERVAVAGYYQGLAGVREHGMYTDTKAYVANVLALRDRFARGDYPG